MGSCARGFRCSAGVDPTGTGARHDDSGRGSHRFPPFGRATSRGELDPSISEVSGATTSDRSSRQVRRGTRGPTGGMRKAVLLSLDLELDVIDGTPEPVLIGLVGLNDRVS